VRTHALNYFCFTKLSDLKSTVCYMQYRICRLCFRLRTALLCWFSRSFATCFGLHGHLQVCRIFYFHMLEGFCFAASFSLFFFTWSHSVCFHLCFSFVIFVVSLQADKHTRKDTTKITKENSTGKTDGNLQCDHMKKSNESECFKHMKIKYPTHLKMAM
jgi:hypothetical protein